MKFSDDVEIIPDWILNHLKKYGNCCCGREIVKKLGKKRLLESLRLSGYNCILRIVPEYYYDCPRKHIKYPLNSYYILELECVVRSYFI